MQGDLELLVNNLVGDTRRAHVEHKSTYIPGLPSIVFKLLQLN